MKKDKNQQLFKTSNITIGWLKLLTKEVVGRHGGENIGMISVSESKSMRFKP